MHFFVICEMKDSITLSNQNLQVYIKMASYIYFFHLFFLFFIYSFITIIIVRKHKLN